MLAAVAPSLGCPVVTGEHGVVYEWRNAAPEDEGTVLRMQQVPEEYEVVPLPGARVHLAYGQGRYAPILWSTWSDDAGEFEVGGVSGPGSRHTLLRVEHRGYSSVDHSIDLSARGSTYHKSRLHVLLKRRRDTQPPDGMDAATPGEGEGRPEGEQE
jgi:hypothetical protein